MGLYVEPDGDKKQWLDRESDSCSVSPPDWGKLDDDVLPVCLVDNGLFYAAGVAYDKREFDYFSKEDGRPRLWYVVKKDRLRVVCPSYDNYIEPTLH